MKKDINDLYDVLIRKHNKEPFHFEAQESADINLIANNPLCGDRFELFINKKGDFLETMYFHGFGCALSMASTSIMLELMENKSGTEALEICREFFNFLDNSVQPSNEIFKAFTAIHEHPARMDCVKLSWLKMKERLESGRLH